MPTLQLDQLPRDVAEIVTDVAAFLGVAPADVFVADDKHEELSTGAFSIAFEGDHDWPYRFTERAFIAAREAGRDAFYPTRHPEAGSGWYLAVYPVRD